MQPVKSNSGESRHYMRRALTLARRGTGLTSPNPMVGAVIVKGGKILGEGWHQGPGQPHAEVEAIRDAQSRGHSTQGSQLYVTLEPCCTTGRTPPCTDAITSAKIRRVSVAAVDPNPKHAGRGLDILKQAGVQVTQGLLADTATELNAGFNHWIVHQTPLVTVKAAMTLDGKIATKDGASKWITGIESRRMAMKLRLAHDAILVGSETVLHDNPSLTVRSGSKLTREHPKKQLLRIVLDTRARTPVNARVCQDGHSDKTLIVVGKDAPKKKVKELEKRVTVWKLPLKNGHVSLRTLLRRLGTQGVTSLLVEGGGTVNASFIEQQLAHRIAFFYAPKILGGAASRTAVAGKGFDGPNSFSKLDNIRWRQLGVDLLLTADIQSDPI